MTAKQAADKTAARIYRTISLIACAALLAVAAAGWYGYSFATGMVRSELGAQKIYFPPKGSPALDPDTYPDLQQYAGQLVDTGPEAKAYANGYIGRHIAKSSGGKTYAEISTEAMKNPKDQKLQGLKATLFQGETLRGMLLGNGYAFWTMGMIARAVAIFAFVLAVVAGLLALRFTKAAGK